MREFSKLLKKIRNESGLTQDEFAQALGVSKPLIAMVETGQKEVSKALVEKLANTMEVHPSSITPFLFNMSKSKKLSGMEEKLMSWGESFQNHLIRKKSNLIKEKFYEQRN